NSRFGPASQPLWQGPTHDASSTPLLSLPIATRWGHRRLRLAANPLFALALRRAFTRRTT
ncbi:MAG: hypothetical protein QXS54_06670, partial [Candidatus Methanomethylicaceae archaeon]